MVVKSGKSSLEAINRFWSWFSENCQKFGARFENAVMLKELDRQVRILGSFRDASLGEEQRMIAFNEIDVVEEFGELDRSRSSNIKNLADHLQKLKVDDEIR